MALNSKETALVVASILFPFLAAFFTILRFRARSKSLAPRKADDYWLVAATVCRPKILDVASLTFADCYGPFCHPIYYPWRSFKMC